MEKTAIVTGSAGYVGSAVAKRLAEDGFRVALFFHTEQPDLASLHSTGHAAYRADLTNRDEVRAAVDAAENDMGPIGVLVHAAGKEPARGSFVDSSAENLHEQFKVNALGSFLIVAEVGKRMKARKSGTIIGITSVAAENAAAGKGLGAYVPAKAALRSMLGLLRAELAAFGVRVEEVAPGFMEGGMNADLPQAFKEIGKAANPYGVPASPEEVAEAALRCLDR